MRYTGSGRRSEGGAPATHKQDFNAHIFGTDWRHTADQILLLNPIDGTQGLNVQSVLENIAASSGYYEIGDGYSDCANDVSLAFQAAFASPLMSNGGVIFLKSGSYCTSVTTIVPPGISIVGESTGSTFINARMSETPVFLFQAGSVKPYAKGSSVLAQQFLDSNVLSDISIYDNKDGDVNSGRPTMSTVPFVQFRHGANLIVKNCVFIGRALQTISSSLDCSFAGFSTTGTTTPNVGTNILIHNCYIDGVRVGIDSDLRQGNLDLIAVNQSKVRTFGAGSAGTGRFISTVNCNLDISDNLFLGSFSDGTDCFLNLKNIAIANNPTNMSFSGNLGNVSSSIAFLNDQRSVRDYISVSGCNSFNNTRPSVSYAEDIVSGFLSSEGTAATTAKGTIQHTFAHRTLNHSTATSATYVIDPRNVAHAPGTLAAGYSLITITVTAPLSDVVNLNITSVPGSVPRGTMFEVVVINLNGADITMNWAPEFLFTNQEDGYLGVNNERAGFIARWKGVSFLTQTPSTTPVYLMEKRVEYNAVKQDLYLVQEFASTTTYTKPSWVHDDTPVTLIGIGGGGGGAGGNSGASSAGGGGGGSGMIVKVHVLGSQMAGSADVFVGVAGVGGSGDPSTPFNGTGGGSTSIIGSGGFSLFRAYGGCGGIAASFTPTITPDGGAGYSGGGGGGNSPGDEGLGGKAFGGVDGMPGDGVDGGGGSRQSLTSGTVGVTYFSVNLTNNGGTGASGEYAGGGGANSSFPFLVTPTTVAADGGTGPLRGRAGVGPGAGGGGGYGTISSGDSNGGTGASGYAIIVWGRHI